MIPDCSWLISLKKNKKLLGMKGLKGSQSAVEVAETLWSCVTHGFFVHLQMHGFSSCTSWCSFCTCSCHVLEFKRLKRTQLALQILAFINHNWLVLSNNFLLSIIYILYYIYGIFLPIDELIFFRMVVAAPTSLCWSIGIDEQGVWYIESRCHDGQLAGHLDDKMIGPYN